jgi:chemotaxis protein CheZ
MLAENADFISRSIRALNAASVQGDEAVFDAILASLVANRRALAGECNTDVVTDLRRVTGDLHAALERFRIDSRLVTYAEKEMPDARARLEHVLRLTDDAAHRTMDLVEQSCPLADRIASAAAQRLAEWYETASVEPQMHEKFLAETKLSMEAVREKLSEVLLAQGYQDLSGQIIRGVMKLVGELEIALGDLVRLSGGVEQVSAGSSSAMLARGFGPVVPGVSHGAHVDGQRDVDALLSDLGM